MENKWSDQKKIAHNTENQLEELMRQVSHKQEIIVAYNERKAGEIKQQDLVTERFMPCLNFWLE